MYTQRAPEFGYERAASVDDAVRLLAQNPDARPLAGGHSLIPLLKTRFVEPAVLVDIGRIPGLDGIDADGDGLRIGALARHASVASSEVVRSRCRVLAETAALIGDRQVRNRGTIGGSLAHADPGADYPTVVTALDATIAVAGPDGPREIAVRDFFRGIFATSLAPGELITSVHVPALPAGTGAAYVKHGHPASGYAVAAVAAVVAVDAGRCTRARIVVGGVTGSPQTADAAAEALVGVGRADDAGIAAAAERVSGALEGALGDTYASPEYRVHLAGVLARRAMTEALARAVS